MQHTLLSHSDARRISKVNESPHHLGADITQSHLRRCALFKAAGEHGLEIETA